MVRLFLTVLCDRFFFLFFLFFLFIMLIVIASTLTSFQFFSTAEVKKQQQIFM